MEVDDEADANMNSEPWSATDEEDLREAVSSGASLDDVASFLSTLLNVPRSSVSGGNAENSTERRIPDSDSFCEGSAAHYVP
jgi:hypothetical protein